jgi:hypothetical protein
MDQSQIKISALPALPPISLQARNVFSVNYVQIMEPVQYATRKTKQLLALVSLPVPSWE